MDSPSTIPIPVFDLPSQDIIQYNIPVALLVQKYHPSGKLRSFEKDAIYDRISDDLIQLVKTGTIWFPYQKYFRELPETIFQSMQNIDATIKHDRYNMRSYYPLYNTFLPPLFRGVPTVIVIQKAYTEADVLSDLFIENFRLKAKRYDQKLSILEHWMDPPSLKEIFKKALLKTSVTNDPHITPELIRDTIYDLYPETQAFSITGARQLLATVLGPDLAGKKLLDISAGWGDRLLASISLGMDYIGFDPNTDLISGHTAMIDMFGDNNRHKVIYEPFETGTIPYGPYDVILTSPPYFNIEEYVPGQQGQSIVSYPKYNEWMVRFLFASLKKAWDNLKDDGYLILHLGDAKTIKTTEATNIFIETNLERASFEGLIGLCRIGGFPRPVWVWKKVSVGIPIVVWEPTGMEKQIPSSERTLFRTYPNLQIELISYHIGQLIPTFEQRKKNANLIRSVIMSTSEPLYVNNLLGNDLMISSLLETLSTEAVIEWGTNVVHSTPDRTLELLTTFVSNKAPYYDIRKQIIHDLRFQIINHHPMVPKDIIIKLFNDNLLLITLHEVWSLDEIFNWAKDVINDSY
jgi:hypothetical protein